MGEYAKTLGPQLATVRSPNVAATLDSCGQTWKLSALVQSVKGQFEVWLEEHAEKKLDQRKAAEKEAIEAATARKIEREAGLAAIDDKYEAKYAALQEQIDGLEFSWGSRRVFKALQQIQGQCVLLGLLLAPNHGELSQEQLEKIMTGNPEGLARALRKLRDAAPNSDQPETGETTPAKTSPESLPVSVVSLTT